MVRKDNTPQNLSLLKKIVLNLIRIDATDSVKTSLRLKRKRAAWDDDIRMKRFFNRLTPHSRYNLWRQWHTTPSGVVRRVPHHEQFVRQGQGSQ